MGIIECYVGYAYMNYPNGVNTLFRYSFYELGNETQNLSKITLSARVKTS